jgi:hypothetical protein
MLDMASSSKRPRSSEVEASNLPVWRGLADRHCVWCGAIVRGQAIEVTGKQHFD